MELSVDLDSTLKKIHRMPILGYPIWAVQCEARDTVLALSEVRQ